MTDTVKESLGEFVRYKRELLTATVSRRKEIRRQAITCHDLMTCSSWNNRGKDWRALNRVISEILFRTTRLESLDMIKPKKGYRDE